MTKLFLDVNFTVWSDAEFFRIPLGQEVPKYKEKKKNGIRESVY